MNEYRDIYKSLFRFANDFAATAKFSGYDIEILNLEAFSTPTEWPETDFIGLDQFRLELDDKHMVSIYATFVVSTQDDKNLLKMNEITNLLVNEFIPSKRILIYSGDTGNTRGAMIVRDGTRVDSCVQFDSQPARPVFVSMRSDQIMSSAA